LHYFKIQNGILLYEGKDGQELREFEIKYDPERVKGLLQALSKLKKEIEIDSVPLRLDDYLNNWQCRYCNFDEICKIISNEPTDWKKAKEKIKLSPAFKEEKKEPKISEINKEPEDEIPF